MSLLKVAAVQASPVFLDLDKSVEKLISILDEAGSKGVDVISFPETFLPGYTFWPWLGTPAWGMQFVGRYFENSIVAGSKHDEAIKVAVKRNNLHAIIGVSERVNGSLYIAQWHYGRDGEVISRRHKLKPTHVERTVFGEGNGSHLIVNDTDAGRIGGLCCWEHMQPLVKYSMYAQNEQIHAAAWPSLSLYEGTAYALGWQVNTAASQVYAVEGQCFVLAASSVVTEEMLDMLCDTPDKRELLPAGGGYARIYGPDGSPLAENLAPDEEGILIAEVDLGMIAYAKAAGDPAGHYSRPDVLRLMINKDPSPRVMDFTDANQVLSAGSGFAAEEGARDEG